MSYTRPVFRHPELSKNSVGFAKSDYEGAISTLCAGCGHDSISAALVQACYELSILPHQLAKLSGIGCSSKTPTYFLGNSHGFNTVHGRMPSVATGANLANKDLVYLGVSGDGDTASIGMGQFVHAIRRNVNMVYIVMNNGCYGLTKGQDSATADLGSISKSGKPNDFFPVDLVGVALELGATFVARSFSGDKGQLIPLIKGAMSHSGFALIDVISPCVTFNNTPKSTKGYSWVRDHIEATASVDFIPIAEEIKVDYSPGESRKVQLHNDDLLLLHKLDKGWDPTNRDSASDRLHKANNAGEILTGLLYVDPESKDLHHSIKSHVKPLNSMSEKELTPEKSKLESVNNEFR
jgi:2-oxoglutarate ferredoxin oxidoreductase subunit beta